MSLDMPGYKEHIRGFSLAALCDHWRLPGHMAEFLTVCGAKPVQSATALRRFLRPFLRWSMLLLEHYLIGVSAKWF
jgi:hypothetical protein